MASTSTQLLLGNGSHELLMQFAQVFAGPGRRRGRLAVRVRRVRAGGAGRGRDVAASRRRCRATHAMPRGHDLDAIAAAITPATRLVYLANPNNPTGTWFGATRSQRSCARVPADVLVVVDEAYAEFVDAPDYASALPLLDAHPNLVVTRTFSKAYALAGLRVGYAVAHPGLVAVMERVRESFNVNMVGLAAAEAALGDDAHLHWSLARNAEQRDGAGRCAARARLVRASVADQFPAGRIRRAHAARSKRRCWRRAWCCGRWPATACRDCLRITVGDARREPAPARRTGRGR